MLKTHISFAILSSVAALCFPSVWNFSSCLFKASPLIGQLTYAWASTANNKGAAVLNQLLRAKLAVWHKLCKCDVVM